MIVSVPDVFFFIDAPDSEQMSFIIYIYLNLH